MCSVEFANKVNIDHNDHVANMPPVVILRWVSYCLFRYTYPKFDSPHNSISICSFETKSHPYDEESCCKSVPIVVPGASKLVISFNKKSNTIRNLHRLDFYTQKALFKQAPKFSFSGSQFEDFETSSDRLFYSFEMDGKDSALDSSNGLWGWQFSVKVEFEGSQDINKDAVRNVDGVSLLKSGGSLLLNSFFQIKDEVTKRFASLILANFATDHHTTARIIHAESLQFFFQYPREDSCTNVAAFCLNELMKDKYNCLSILQLNNEIRIVMMQCLLNAIVDSSEECQFYAANCISNISAVQMNVSLLVNCGVLEAMQGIIETYDHTSALAMKCFECLRHMAMDRKSLLKYGQGNTIDKGHFENAPVEMSTDAQQKRLDMTLSQVHTSTMQSFHDGECPNNLFPDATVIESEHPLKRNFAVEQTVYMPGASSLCVTIEKFEIGNGKDLLSFEYDHYGEHIVKTFMSVHEIQVAVNTPIIISGDEVTFFIRSNIVPQSHFWGYSIKIQACYFDSPLLRSSANNLRRTDPTLVESSARPYTKQYDEVQTVTMPHADAILVTFDPTSSTEPNVDHVTFYKDINASIPYHNATYSGQDFPGVDGMDPLYIPSNSFTYTWISKSKRGHGGWKFFCKPAPSIFEKLKSKPFSRVYESVHPLQPVLNEIIEVNIPEANGIELHFHKNSSLEFDKRFVAVDDDDDMPKLFVMKLMDGCECASNEVPRKDQLRAVEVYTGNNLPGLENIPNLVLKHNRIWLLYSVHHKLNYPLDRNLFPFGFRVVASPVELTEALPSLQDELQLPRSSKHLAEMASFVTSHLLDFGCIVNSFADESTLVADGVVRTRKALRSALGILSNYSFTVERSNLIKRDFWEMLCSSVNFFLQQEPDSLIRMLIIQIVLNLTVNLVGFREMLVKDDLFLSLVRVWGAFPTDIRHIVADHMKQLIMLSVNIDDLDLQLLLGRRSSCSLVHLTSYDVLIGTMLDGLEANNTYAKFHSEDASDGEQEGGDKKLSTLESIQKRSKSMLSRMNQDDLVRILCELANTLAVLAEHENDYNRRIPIDMIAQQMKLLTMHSNGVKKPILQTILCTIKHSKNITPLGDCSFGNALELLISEDDELRSLALQLVKFLSNASREPYGCEDEVEELQVQTLLTVNHKEMVKSIAERSNVNLSDEVMIPSLKEIFNAEERQLPSWINPLLMMNSKVPHQVLTSFVRISAHMNTVKGFFHPDIIEHVSSSSKSLTVTFWLYIDDKQANDFIRKSESEVSLEKEKYSIFFVGSPDSKFSLNIKYNARKESIEVSNVVENKSATKNVKPIRGEWNFVCLTFSDGSVSDNIFQGRKCDIYLGNKLVTTGRYLDDLGEVFSCPWYIGHVDEVCKNISAPISGRIDTFTIFQNALPEDEMRSICAKCPSQLVGPTILSDYGEIFIGSFFRELQKINFKFILSSRSRLSDKKFQLACDILDTIVLFFSNRTCADALMMTLESTSHTALDVVLLFLNDCIKEAMRKEGRAMRALTRRGLTMGSLFPGGEVEGEKNLESKHPYTIGSTFFQEELISPRKDIIDGAHIFDEDFESDEEMASDDEKSNVKSLVGVIDSSCGDEYAIKVWFDRKTRTRNSDYVRLYSDEECTQLLAQYSGSTLGRKRGGWPLLEDPAVLLVTGNVYVRFHSKFDDDSEKNQIQALWGWRMYAILTVDPYHVCERHKDTVVVSSSGPRSLKVTIPDVSALQVMFRSDSVVGDSDYICFQQFNSKKLYGAGKYCGSVKSRDLPGHDSPVIIDSDKVKIKFTTLKKETKFNFLVSPVDVSKKSRSVSMLERLAKFMSQIVQHSNIASMIEAEGNRRHSLIKHIENATAVLGDHSSAVNCFDETLTNVLTEPLLLQQELKECARNDCTDAYSLKLLLVAIAALSDRPNDNNEPFYTDISPVPFVRQPFTRVLRFPFAEYLELTFMDGSSLPHSTMLTIHGDPSFPDDTRVFYSSTKSWEPLVFNGGNIHIAFSLYENEDLNDNVGDIDLSAQYCIHIRPIYGGRFVPQGSHFFQRIGLDECFSIVMRGMQSSDEITALYASRVLANFLFSRPLSVDEGWSAVSERFYNRASKRFTVLFKDELSAMSIFNIYNKGDNAISLCNSLCIIPTQVADIDTRRNIYFEVTCPQSCAKIGYVIPFEERLKSEYIPSSQKNTSAFGVDSAIHNFYLDLFTKELVWGKQKRHVNFPTVQKGDILGMQLDAQTLRIKYYLNGKAIADEASFDATSHGGSDLWICGFRPAIWLNTGVITPFIFNFGQHRFEFPPKGKFTCRSPLEFIRRSSCPLRKAEKFIWQHNTWSIYDGSTTSGYRPVHDADGVFLQRRDAFVTEKRLAINFRRQIARGLCGSGSVDESIVSVVLELAKSSDITTRNWAIRCLLGAFRKGKYFHLIINDPAVLLIILKTCTETSQLQSQHVFNDALDCFENKDVIFKMMQEYVYARSAPSNAVLVESEHPYTAGRKNYPAEEIHFPHANSMEVIFDPSTKTQKDNDYLCFYSVDPQGLDESRRAFYRIGPRLSGTNSSDWPGIFNPLYIPHNHVWVTFSTDDALQYWGYRFIATGKDTDMNSPYLSLHSDNAACQEFESSHPYMKDSSVTAQIMLPGNSKFFKITFDVRSQLNISSCKTSLTFYRRNPSMRGGVKYPISYNFSGVAFPGINGMEPLIIELDNEFTDIDFGRKNRSIWYHFESDDSSVEWGWKFVVAPCDPPEDPLKQLLQEHNDGLVIETNHPCIEIDRTTTATAKKEYLFRREVYFPGAESIALVFDPRSESRIGNNYQPKMQVLDEPDVAFFFEMMLLVKCYLTDNENQSEQGFPSESTGFGGKVTDKKFAASELSSMPKWVVDKNWFFGGGTGGKTELMKSNFPTSASMPLVVPANRFHVAFASLYQSDCVMWGWRCIAYPMYNRPQQCLVFDKIAAMDNALLITDETAHVGKDGRVRVKLPDTELVQICFDEEETGCFNEDPAFKIKVFSGRPPKRVRTALEDSKLVGTFKCTSGRRYFPGVDGYPPLVLNKPNLWLDVTQPKNKGYKGSYTLVVAPYRDELESWIGKDGEIVDMMHPYKTPFKKSFIYESPCDDLWMEIAFDRRTSLGPGASLTLSSRQSSMAEFMTVQGDSMEGSYPTIEYPARIAASSCVLTFMSTNDGPSTFWGFRVAIRSIPAVNSACCSSNEMIQFPSEKNAFDITYRLVELQLIKETIQGKIFELLHLLTRKTSPGGETTRYVETERINGIYLPDVNMSGAISFPLAQSLEVSFSPLTHTEIDSDVLHLYARSSMRDEDYLRYYNESKRDEAIATFSGPFTRIGHWVNMTVSQDRLYYKFSSETVLEEMWGFMMCVTPQYCQINTPPADLLDDLVLDQDCFNMLEKKLRCRESASAGLIFANVLLSEDIRVQCAQRYGVEWFKSLLLSESDDVIIVTLNALLAKSEPYGPSQSGLNFLLDNKCIPSLIKLLGHDNEEIKGESLKFLYALFSRHIERESQTKCTVESVLLDIVGTGDIEELRHASDILSKLLQANKVDANTAKSNESSFGGNLMLQLKNIFVDKNKVETRLEVALTMCTLMTTENGISEFLGRHRGVLQTNSFECLQQILDMLSYAVCSNLDDQASVCLQFLKNLSQKSLYKADYFKIIRNSSGYLSLISHSIQVREEMRPVWLDLSSPVEVADNTNNDSKTVGTSDRKSGHGFTSKFLRTNYKKNGFDGGSGNNFMVGFWLRPTGFLDRDGLPIFFTGDFSGILAPPRSQTTFRVSHLIRQGRVYFEVTLNSYDETGKDCLVSFFC